MEVSPGIFRLELPLGEKAVGMVNCYLLRGKTGWLLIDSGWNKEETVRALEQQVEECGARLKDIERIVVTHIHPDHIGLAGRLREISGAKLMLHKLDAGFINSRYVEIQALMDRMAESLRANGVPERDLFSLTRASLDFLKFVLPAEPDETLSGGETISTGLFDLEVIWTPGHSLGQICLHERSRKILFSGDHVMAVTTPHIGLHAESGDNPLGDYLNSLKTLSNLEVELVLPAHEQVFTNLRQRIEELFAHHQKREQSIRGVLEKGSETAFDIAQKIPWMLDVTDGTNWSRLSPMDKRLAVMETMAHLEAMRFRGAVNKLSNDGIISYRLTS